MAKPVPRLTEEQFRANEGMRKELASILESHSFTQALQILTLKRQQNEAKIEAISLPAPELVSVRMQSQRVGMEGFINDLRDLCNPPKQAPEHEEAEFGANQE